jgi:3-hydroxybutyryl-CoA dehydrogenase
MEGVTMLGVVGSGVMGAGIAQLAALGGLPTRLSDASAEALERGLAHIDRDLARGAERGRWTSEEADAARARVTASNDLDDCELIIEAVPEELELKVAVLSSLPLTAALATNTSSLAVTEIAARVPSPERVLGMHFFNPPTRLHLIELVAGAQTGAPALELGARVATAMGCRVLRARDSVGFIVNRCARSYSSEAMVMLEESAASVEEIDRACRAAGFKMGPFELMDLIGLDTSLAVSRTFYERSGGEPRWRPSARQEDLVAAGKLGRKTGSGWYDPAPSPHSDGPVDEALSERIVCQLVNEACFALGDGVATREDIDAGMQLGLNYPRGPLEWGEQLGWAHVVTVLESLDRHGPRYRVAPELSRAAARS